MKKLLTVLITALLLTAALAGCGAGPAQTEDKPTVIATIFPEYDWVMNVLGDRAEAFDVTMLLDNGVDLHSYQPSVSDMVRISDCDLFIYVGGESDEWVEEALQNASNKDMLVIDLMEVLGEALREEELVEGMEGGEEEAEGEEPEYDEHVWLSLRNAALITEAIRDAFIRLDEAHADVYTANTAAYLGELADLDERYEAAVKAAGCRTLLFGDRFPFRYLVEDYGLEYYAAFSGCSAESEAGFKTIIFLAEKVDELQLPAVLTLESSDGKIAQTIVKTAQSTSVSVLKLNSLQSTTSKDIEAGVSYLSVMEENLGVLQKALG